MTEFQLLIMMPIFIGVVIFVIPDSMKIIKGLIALIVTAVTLYLSVTVFRLPTGVEAGLYSLQSIFLPVIDKYMMLKVDGLSKLIVLFIGVFGFLYAIYSISYLNKNQASKGSVQSKIPPYYYSYSILVNFLKNLFLF